MRVDAILNSALTLADRRARELEGLGYDGIWTAETSHDPFLPIALAAPATERAELGTSIAVGFARTPMLLANLGWDLQALSGGRFILGLGSQIRPHITKRFSMPWSHPAARMREMVQATRAIWDAWLGEGPLRFRGEFYTHTLMTPMFSPAADELVDIGPPRIFLAGVGQAMTEVAGEVADGFICHAFTTPRYLREATIPALARGAQRAGRSVDDVEVSAPVFIAFDPGALDAIRRQLAFYGSTPAYRTVLELHGWGELHEELHRMSKRGEWAEMGEVIDDEVLHTFALVGTPDRVADLVAERYGGIAQRLTVMHAEQLSPEAWSSFVGRLRAIG